MFGKIPIPGSFSYLIRTISALCIALLVAISTTYAQVGTASLSGAILDASGAVVPDADVILHSTQGAFARTVRTAADGSYVIASLQPGTYELTVRAAGFQEQKSAGIQLSSGQAATVNLNLAVAGASSEVTV